MTVEEVIGEAREEHRAFVRETTPDAVVLRFLSRWQQGMLSRLADKKPDAIKSTQQITMPISPWTDGEALNAYIRVHGGEVVFDEATREHEPIRMVSYTERFEEDKYRWGVYIADRTLFPLGEEEDWDDVARIDVHFFPEGTEFTAVADQFELVGQAKPVAVAAAADFLARKTPDGVSPAVDRAFFAVQRQEAEGRYLDEVAGRRQAYVSKVRNVW